MYIQKYHHPYYQHQAEITLYADEGLWSVEIIQDHAKRLHGLYPSLPSAQLIINALGFELSETVNDA
jgi:hypothetical protein